MAVEWLLYAPAEQLNEATHYYIETVMRAARALGREPRHVESLRSVPWNADVFVVECKSAFKLRIARPHARCWLWMQGVVPEEARLQFGSRWREALWTLFERSTLPKAQGVLMVSQAMRAHFACKYGLTTLPTFVMPCANAALDPASFWVPNKYRNPRFVYAGSMHTWQCFDLTLDVYRRVKAQCPRATLTVLTADQAQARRAVEASSAADIDIDIGFVPLAQLQATLATYKYGFVLRAPHVVNRVATPTKVSSYMAAGVIPVMTTAVDDYVTALRGIEPLVMCEHLDASKIAQAILDVEERELQAGAVLRSYSAVFSRYFDHAAYDTPLRDFLQITGLQAASDRHVA